MLERIKAQFGVGVISLTENSCSYRVYSLKDLINVIIPYFEQYPLVSQKKADFANSLFKSIVEIMDKRKHLTNEGLQQIVNIKASMNNGLSDTHTAAFPNIEAVPRPVVDFKVIPDPHWITGFTDAEGVFSLILGFLPQP